MKRSPLWLGLLAASVIGLSPGCEPWHRQAVRHQEDDLAEPGPAVVDDGPSTETRGFFKKNRQAGAWSSEAREIEKHLGAVD